MGLYLHHSTIDLLLSWPLPHGGCSKMTKTKAAHINYYMDLHKSFSHYCCGASDHTPPLQLQSSLTSSLRAATLRADRKDTEVWSMVQALMPDFQFLNPGSDNLQVDSLQKAI